MQSLFSDSLSSAREQPSSVDDHIAGRIRAGESAGPFSVPPFDVFVSSPLGVVPKKNGKLRLIHPLSYPNDQSVNDGIDKDTFSLQYVMVDDAIDLLCMHGPGTLMAKLDIRNAFCLVPVDPACYYLLGFQWRDQFYFDKVLPFGLRSAPYLFNCIADAVTESQPFRSPGRRTQRTRLVWFT